MSGRERGLFRLIWKNFVASVTSKSKKSSLIGEDYYGTKYYEVSNKTDSFNRPSRYFVPVNKDDHEQEIPAEWEAWLRNRRKDPPTEKELEESYQLAMLKKENAAKIEAKFSAARLEASNLPTVKKGYESFPQYEEYKNHGENYKIKYPK
ncbi:NADH dehydrogenase [ubiquinone] 1 alpha subcomplex assembly factor 2 [Megachile rotundata]|uniref:NADH dehydrogenase [ubiquinone] 1 alpha subcomplex assembly factor 2 n=1 Tax=Megachile rotundata TaxID=143995 RepID=UPI003FD45915